MELSRRLRKQVQLPQIVTLAARLPDGLADLRACGVRQSSLGLFQRLPATQLGRTPSPQRTSSLGGSYLAARSRRMARANGAVSAAAKPAPRGSISTTSRSTPCGPAGSASPWPPLDAGGGLPGMPVCMHACVPACLGGLMLGCLPPPSRFPCIICVGFTTLFECPKRSDGEKETTTRERARETEAGLAVLASDWLAGRLSAGQGEREREIERDGWNDAEIALPCVAIHWCVACPFTCVLLASPPVRIDAGMLVCSLASLCLQRQ